MENLFLFLLRLSFLLPVMAGVFFLTKKVLKPGLAIFSVLLQSLVFGVLNTFKKEYIALLGVDCYFLLYTALEYLGFAMIIYCSAIENRAIIVLTTCSAFFTLNLAYQIIAVDHLRGDSLNIGIEAILILINVIFFFYLRFKTIDQNYLYQNPYFWLMTGMLIYLSFTFFFFILVNHVDNEVIKNYYHLSYIGDIIKNILFAVALFYMPRRTELLDRAHSFNAPHLDLI